MFDPVKMPARLGVVRKEEQSRPRTQRVPGAAEMNQGRGKSRGIGVNRLFVRRSWRRGFERFPEGIDTGAIDFPLPRNLLRQIVVKVRRDPGPA